MPRRLTLTKRDIDSTWRDYKPPFACNVVEITGTVDWKWSTNGGSIYRLVPAFVREVIWQSFGYGMASSGAVLFQYKADTDGEIYEKITA